MQLITRRTAASSIGLTLSGALWAQAPAFPSRPVRIIIPAAAGSASEAIARLLGDYVSRRLGQPVVVEPIAGGAGIIGTERAMRAPPDGHTLLLGFNQLVTMNPHLYAKLPYDAARDMSPITTIQKSGLLFLVNKDVPVVDVPGLIALAKSQPGKLTYASTGNGSAPHLGMELFKDMAGVDLLHVPYKAGSAAMSDLLAGHVHVKIEPTGTGLPMVRAG
ncbi:MAG: tripartite tricarboxylate transporter substrate binding protein, partial [Desulfobacterales bacterium]|nr:tripartite tricarboxylate transporter substrate binding protein [Desulfobacterales bacterium]